MSYTPENNPYIPGDPYSYDLKWVVDQIKYAISLYEPLSQQFSDLSGKFDALEAYVRDYFANLDLTQEVSDKLDEMAENGSLSALIQPLFDAYKAEIDGDIAAQNAAITVLTARMDTFASLPDGSTAGDAELVDIRVGANGVTYPSAGDAVRAQISYLTDSISDFTTVSIGKNKLPPYYVPGYLNNTGDLTVELDWYSTNYIDVRGLTNVVFSAQSRVSGTRPTVSMFFLTTYDADKTRIEQPSNPGATYTVQEGVSFIRFSFHNDSWTNLMVEPGTAAGAYEPYTISYDLNGKWKGKKWACMGDSLTESNSRATKNYHDYISESTDIEVVNMGRSGSGYKRSYEDNNAFYQRIANVPADSDVVTIFGSGNDLLYISDLGTPTDSGADANPATICGCINKTIDTLISLMPAVQLGIIAPTPWIGEQPTLNNTNAMGQYVEALRQICYIRSIPFLDLYHESNLRPWTAEGRAACYSRDEGNGVHPDETGQKLIASRFEGFLESLLLEN